MNPEKQKLTISRELSKIIRAGIVVPTCFIVAIAGVGCAQQSESISIESESETQVSQQTQETSAVAQTETQETKETKEIGNVISITLVNDESLSKISGEWEGKTYIPKEIVYKDPIEGPKIMQEAFLYTWARALKDRVKDPDFQNISNNDHDLLISTLIEKINNGEDLSFDIYLKDDYSRTAEKQTITPYKVDFRQGINLIFIGEVPDAFKTGNRYTSKNFEVLAYLLDGNIGRAVRHEVDEKGMLTIKLFADSWRPEGWTGAISQVLEDLITQKHIGYKRWVTSPEQIELIEILDPGSEWVNGKEIKDGTPILDIIYQE